MAFKIVRNDITKMTTQAIVNTANEHAIASTGCDTAIYNAAGYDELLAYRQEKIGEVPEGEVFITPGFNLPAEYIIHAVSPLYIDGSEGEEEKLRSCYRKSLELALENGIESISFPLISTGSFGYPKEEGLRIAADEINAFLLRHDMEVYLVVFDDRATALGGKLYPDLEEYIDRNYVEEKREEEYGWFASAMNLAEENTLNAEIDEEEAEEGFDAEPRKPGRRFGLGSIFKTGGSAAKELSAVPHASMTNIQAPTMGSIPYDETVGSIPIEDEMVSAELAEASIDSDLYDDYVELNPEHESKLAERIRHLSDTFSEYLLYLIHDKNMENAEVYKRAIVDKKTFSKIKNNVDYHPQKLTALCLCVGAKLNLDESKDLLARAGYALSPCDKTDIIFSYFIENEIYDMIELDIQLEEHGLPCIIS